MPTILRVIASIVAVLGIGMFALPAGILGGAFLAEIQGKHEPKMQCPHCGAALGEPRRNEAEPVNG